MQTIFRKAQTEHPYAGFYSNLCTQICRMELLMRGLKATKKHLSTSSFRKLLLAYCRESFEIFLSAPLTEEKIKDEKEDDRQEREFRKKHKLFGNIEFVGELYKCQIVTDGVIFSVFNSLLGIGSVSQESLNENTFEAALRLISKLGPTLE